MKTNYKYEATLHINVNKPNVEFIGKVHANSVNELKANARRHAKNWNKHLFGRIHVEDLENGIDFSLNP